MNTQKSAWTVFSSFVVALMLAACGATQPAPSATSVPLEAAHTPGQHAALPTLIPVAPTPTSPPTAPPPSPSPTAPPPSPPPTAPPPSPSPTAPPPSPSPTRPQPASPSYRAQIRITTTSDWTTLRLKAGGYWYDVSVTSASKQAQSSRLEGESLVLSQSLGSAEEGKSVELVAEAFLTGLDPASPLGFEIERGHLGSTQVEVWRYEKEAPSLVAVLTWDGISPGSRNARTFELSAEPFLGATPNEYIVIGQLNFWYYGPGEWGGFEHANGKRVTPLTPLLGETYRASDPSVVYRQIEWAVEYGVDAFSIEWTTPRGVGCCGSMEDTLDDVFLKSRNVHKVRFAIFYDFVLRLMQTPGLDIDTEPNIDFDQPDVYDTFVSDFVHFATKYFGHPQYLAIDGRPVIYIWATNSYVGDLVGAMQEARERVSELGFDVFIVGDEVCVGCFDPQHASLFDGSSTFTMLIPGIDSDALADVGEAAVEVDRAFQWWRDRIAGLHVAGREDLVNFQPAWAPQYDETYFIFDHPKYVPALSKDQVVEMAMVARKHAEPVGSSGLKLIWLNTWNNWAETTTVEPTVDLGPKYPAGNYQFDMLEVVRDVFGSDTYYTSPVR